jgi:hypothetical protein
VAEEILKAAGVEVVMEADVVEVLVSISPSYKSLAR